MRRKLYLYEVKARETYIPENPWRPWFGKGEKIYLHAKNKKDLLRYFGDEAKRWVREGKIVIRRVGKVMP